METESFISDGFTKTAGTVLSQSRAKTEKPGGEWSQLIDEHKNISGKKTKSHLISKLYDLGFVGQPKEVIDKRAKVWNNMFEKYENLSNDDVVELVQSDNEEDNFYDDDDEEEEEEEEDEEDIEDDENEIDNENKSNKHEYYTKARKSIKKHPVLVQYWIDTGNPPYRLADESSESGCSLSEDDKSEKDREPKLDKSKVKTKRTFKTKSDDSSVDTAAYILSNANVTTKADALAIIEGSKVAQEAETKVLVGKKDQNDSDSDKNDKINNNFHNNSLKKDKSSQSPEKISTSCKKKSKSPEKTATSPEKTLTSPKKRTTSPEKRATSSEKKILNGHDSDKSIDNNVLNCSNKLNSSKIKSSKKSVKLSNAVENLDKISSSLNSVCQDSFKTNSNLDKDSKIEKTPCQIKKSFHRRKLYTGRDSPVDILISSVEKKIKPLFKFTTHPAFQSTPSPKVTKVVRPKKRLIIRTKRRSSRLSIKERQSKEKEKITEKLLDTPKSSEKKLEDTEDDENEPEKNKRKSDGLTIFDSKNCENQTNGDQVEKLKNLCLTIFPVVCLNRISTDIKDEKIFKMPLPRVELNKIGIHSEKIDAANKEPMKKIESKKFKKLEYKRIKKSTIESRKNIKRKRRKVKAKDVEIKRKNSDSILKDIRLIFNETVQVRSPDNKLNSKTGKEFFISMCIGDSSDDDAVFVRPSMNLTRKNCTTAPVITFSSDEDDDFTKFVNQNKTLKIQEEKLEESLNISEEHEKSLEKSVNKSTISTSNSPEIPVEKAKVFSTTSNKSSLNKSGIVKVLKFSDESSDTNSSEEIFMSPNKKLKTNSNGVINKYDDLEENKREVKRRKSDENELKKSPHVMPKMPSPILNKSVAVKNSFSKMTVPRNDSFKSTEKKLITSPTRNSCVKPIDNSKKQFPLRNISSKNSRRIFSTSCDDDDDESSDENTFYRSPIKTKKKPKEDSETEDNNTYSSNTGSSDNPTKTATKLLHPSLYKKIQKPNISLYSNYQATMTFCTNHSSDSDD